MADALDSGSSGSNPVRVQVPFSALDIRCEDTVNSMGLWCFSLPKNRKDSKKGTPLINDEDVAL